MTSLLVKELPSTYVNDDYRTVAKQAGQWSPYITNEGTTLAISGKDFAIVAGDTRMSDGGYSIISRSQSKLFQYASHCVLGSSGMQSDVNTLQKLLKTRAIQYQQRHHNELTTESCAQLLSNTLYYRRFFPYYSFNVMGGVDSQGRGAAYGYDAVGSFERCPYAVTGSASALITSLLDNQYEFKTTGLTSQVNQAKKKELSLEETIDLVKDAFTSAGERDIYTGDSVEIAIITKDGIRREMFELKRD